MLLDTKKFGNLLNDSQEQFFKNLFNTESTSFNANTFSVMNKDFEKITKNFFTNGSKKVDLEFFKYDKIDLANFSDVDTSSIALNSLLLLDRTIFKTSIDFQDLLVDFPNITYEFNNDTMKFSLKNEYKESYEYSIMF